MNTTHNCPKCGCTGVVRSRRRPMERLLLWVKPYRCAVCRHRFYLRSLPQEPAAQTSAIN